MELRRNHSSPAKNVVVDDNYRCVEKVCGGVGDDNGYDTGGGDAFGSGSNFCRLQLWLDERNRVSLAVVSVTVVAMAMGLVKPLAVGSVTMVATALVVVIPLAVDLIFADCSFG
ncbi:hypothetical protein F0562_026683 [Nyssa sinensis]|uniref:Uncharacterized protein n=1 Tax=Nyssa sinensis TaxID=561372 RepID=A0A5J5BFR0_9ASTE|nr:hypothetical protein F0562_026683 [Nyssa sinensis]